MIRQKVKPTPVLIVNKPTACCNVPVTANPLFSHSGRSMALSPHRRSPDSSVNALIPQWRSCSSPNSLTDSPTTERSFPPSSPSDYSGPVCNHHTDLTGPSSSSSSFSLVPDRASISERDIRWRGKKNKESSAKEVNTHNGRLEIPNVERCKQLSQQSCPEHKRKRNGCHGKGCCKCLAGFTVDCAAVCCCPLALLNLAALTFIRLPTSVAWKTLVSLKNKMCSTRRSRPARDIDQESPRPKCNNPCSYGSSPEGNIDLGSYRPKFDSQNFWQHFEAGRLDFGGLSMRSDT